DIAPGEHVHAHNTRTNLSDLDAYRYQPDLVDQPPQPADREVQIYRRANQHPPSEGPDHRRHPFDDELFPPAEGLNQVAGD
ncbi:hypothetical protein Q6322_30115, partial [Klebsiella pneumoniae]|nr:hypothetical protein [Klebsiella pneumoniae]